MAYYALKIAVTTLMIVLISEIAKRNSLAGAVLASVPTVSVLAMIWLYIDTGDADKISALSQSIFWLVLPSLVLFVSLPLLLKQGLGFYWSLNIALILTVASYGLMIWVLSYFGIKL